MHHRLSRKRPRAFTADFTWLSKAPCSTSAFATHDLYALAVLGDFPSTRTRYVTNSSSIASVARGSADWCDPRVGRPTEASNRSTERGRAGIYIL